VRGVRAASLLLFLFVNPFLVRARQRKFLRQLFTPAELAPTSANGAPIHLLKSSDQSVAVVHRPRLSLLTWRQLQRFYNCLRKTVRRDAEPKPHGSVSIGPLLYSSETDRRISAPSSGPNSGGGVHSASPANSGFFPPRVVSAIGSARDCRTTLITLCYRTTMFRCASACGR